MYNRNVRAIQAFVGFVLVMVTYVVWASGRVEATLTRSFTTYMLQDVPEYYQYAE